MNRSTPGVPVHHQLLAFTQTHVHGVGDAIQPSHPLSSPSPAPNPSGVRSLQLPGSSLQVNRPSHPLDDLPQDFIAHDWLLKFHSHGSCPLCPEQSAKGFTSREVAHLATFRLHSTEATWACAREKAGEDNASQNK